VAGIQSDKVAKFQNLVVAQFEFLTLVSLLVKFLAPSGVIVSAAVLQSSGPDSLEEFLPVFTPKKGRQMMAAW
jgi:hypothetical protein